jgi:hypothetical protein
VSELTPGHKQAIDDLVENHATTTGETRQQAVATITAYLENSVEPPRMVQTPIEARMHATGEPFETAEAVIATHRGR